MQFNILLQKFAPQHQITKLMGLLGTSTCPVVAKYCISRFIKKYNVDLSDAKIQDIHAFASFNEFFTRELKPESRPICFGANEIASPVDGLISQLGPIENGSIIQAKGQKYTTTRLLGSQEEAQKFQQGSFTTLYLAPRDYHRIHMPIDGQLTKMRYIPGDLFSVNPLTAEHVPNLFARNERVVCYFDTAIGPIAMVLVGAMIVGSIHTRWMGRVAPKPRTVTEFDYPANDNQHITLKKGEEMGRFQLGSTVILLLPPSQYQFQASENQSLQMGQLLANFSS